MDRLNHLRHELLVTNHQLLKIMSARKEQVHAIQEIKTLQGQSIFCPEREWELFNQLQSELSELSIRELLSLSLIIEEDACSYSQTYPAWSEGVHLVDGPTILYQQINPILLKVTHLSLFEQLKLKADFDFIYKF